MKENRISFVSKGDTIYLVTSTEAVDFLNGSIESGFIQSLHLISGQGIFHTLVECCKENKLGFDITGDSDLSEQEFLHGKTKYTAIVSVDEDQETDFVDYMFNHNVELTLLGHVTKGELRMDDTSYGFIEEFL